MFKFGRVIRYVLAIGIVFVETGFAEINLITNEDYMLNMSVYFRGDTVFLQNNIDLDSETSDDRTAYFGIDYNIDFDLKTKEQGPELYLKLERNGPYDYNSPLFIHNTLYTTTTGVSRYRDEDLLPQVEEFWTDFPLAALPLRIKGGLFPYEVGSGFALTGNYENYGVLFYAEKEDFKLRAYYCRPDFEHKSYLGSRPKQDKEQGINYEHSRADFFALDSSIPLKHSTLQPYVGVLIDNTGDKRNSYFSASTHKDTLGTFGASWDAKLDKFSLIVEAARNFGKAESSDGAYKDVEHVGYAFYAYSSYEFSRITPHGRLFYASGNRITTDMVDNAEETLTSGKNRAFSNYSPLNANLADSQYPNLKDIPLVAMANGYGLNYGIPRPGTFGDPYLPENLILSGLGFDCNLSEKMSLTFDWWYMRAAEKGIGTYGGSAKELSTDLGNEIDVSLSYSLNEHVCISLANGYFFPGEYYKEERDDPGTLFTPIVRGDGKADGAYQIELSVEVQF